MSRQQKRPAEPVTTLTINPTSAELAPATVEALTAAAQVAIDQNNVQLDGLTVGIDPGTDEVAGWVTAERVYIVSAPAGPRRRAGISFGPEPRELRWDELGDDPEASLEALRADPFLKIDGRYEETPISKE